MIESSLHRDVQKGSRETRPRLVMPGYKSNRVWNVYDNVNQSAAIGGAGLREDEVMPEGDVTITQGTLTIGEYGLGVNYEPPCLTV